MFVLNYLHEKIDSWLEILMELKFFFLPRTIE